MRIYNVTTTVEEYRLVNGLMKKTLKEMKDTLILSDDDDLDEFVHMLYTDYIIVKFDYEEARNVHISKSYIEQEALKMIKIEFK